MLVNDPKVLAEVEAAFAHYEVALLSNDLEMLDACFWSDTRTIRYGTAENLYGIDEVRAFRIGRSPVGLARTLSRTVITTFSHDMATASTLFGRDHQAGRIGRQQQTWARMPDGWKIVAAHVSLIADPGSGATG